MSTQQPSEKHDPVNVASNAGSTSLIARATYSRAQASMQKFRLGLVASSQALQDAPESRSKLMSSIEIDLRVVHPLYRIPPVLWASIFEFLVQYVYDRDSLSPLNTLHIIGNVCHGWRTVIRSLPELWSEISLSTCLNVPPSAKQDFPNFLLARTRTLTDILHFSNDLPLDISIDIQANASPAVLHAVMFILIQQSERWSRIRIEDDKHFSGMRAFTSSITSLGVTTLPLLEHCNIGFTTYTTEGQHLHDVATFSSLSNAMPKLHSLDLRNIDPSTCSDFFPRSKSKDLDINGGSPFLCMRITYGFTSLVTLRLYLTGDEVKLSQGGPPHLYELPNVEDLWINAWNTTFLQAMMMPKLRILEIESIRRDECNCQFACFISLSRCIITEFTCSEYWVPSEESGGLKLRTLLRTLPGLQTLHFNFLPDGRADDLLKLLGEVEEDQMRLCPRLQILHLGVQVWDMLLLKPYVDMIEVRWRIAKKLGNSGLREVGPARGSLDEVDSPEAKEQADRLEQMRREGLVVNL